MVDMVDFLHLKQTWTIQYIKTIDMQIAKVSGVNQKTRSHTRKEIEKDFSLTAQWDV